jgi:hypothetical protein
MIKYSTTFILMLTVLVGELHTFWENGSTEVVNWIWSENVPMTVQWNIKYLTNQVNMTLYFVALFLFAYYPNRVNFATVSAFILFSLVDTLMYLYNFKRYEYGLSYFILLILWILAYLWKTPKK